MNPIDILLLDHKHIRGLLKKLDHIEKSTKKEKMAFYNELRNLLVNHEKMEQSLFYPALKKLGIFNETIKHLENEEKKAEELLAKLEDTPQEEEWFMHLFQLKRDVEHHANEEENKLFPRVLEEVPNDIMSEIGNLMSNYKEKSIKSGFKNV